MVRTSKAPLLAVAVDRQSDEPAYRQLYNQVRAAILDGRLKPGRRLPSSRGLAKDLGVSRNTVLTAFEMLLHEGYTESGIGSGTRVSAVLPEALLSARDSSQRPVDKPATVSGARISRLATSLDSMRQRTRADQRTFRPGLPAVEHFPWNVWGRLAGRVWRHPPSGQIGGGDLR